MLAVFYLGGGGTGVSPTVSAGRLSSGTISDVAYNRIMYRLPGRRFRKVALSSETLGAGTWEVSLPPSKEKLK